MLKHGVEEEYNKKESKENCIRKRNSRKDKGNIDNLWR